MQNQANGFGWGAMVALTEHQQVIGGFVIQADRDAKTETIQAFFPARIRASAAVLVWHFSLSS